MPHKLSVAPMMGCTDQHCRVLFRNLSPNTMLYSEMVTTGALIHGNTARLLNHADDAPCGIQLGGSDPRELATAAMMVEDAGYQEVNLNCGCPSDRVRQGGIGACLMAEPNLVAECYDAMSNAVTIPVTIKSRIGIDQHDDYPFFYTFINNIFEAGCREFHVHARKAILKGLSPKENREIPPLKYDFVRQIQSDFGDATFILNGGIRTVDEATGLLTEFAGVMMGRAPYANPYLLNELEQAVFDGEEVDRFSVLERYIEYTERETRAGTHVKHMARHLLGLFTGLPGARAFRRHLSTHMYHDDANASVVRDAAQLVHVSGMESTGT